MRHLQAILDTLKDLNDEQQKPFRDATMITSENDWHDLVHTNDAEIIHMNDTDYTWYREDDLRESGYIHESEIIEQAVEDIEGLCVQLAKEKEPQTIISVETLNILYKNQKKTGTQLKRDEQDLIKAILEENGYG